MKPQKEKKAAGPGKIYNEYLKDTAQLLIPTWTKLYNKCLEVATIPKQWKQLIIKVPYKGKGDPKDTNKYRKTENNPFKVFTKLITERIRQIIEEYLPDSLFGCNNRFASLCQNLFNYSGLGEEDPLSQQWNYC